MTDIIISHPAHDPAAFDEFGCHVYAASPSTPDKLTPTKRFFRQVSSWNVTMADGKSVPFWGFKDPNVSGSDSPWPSKIIRVNVGDIVHCNMKPSKGTHTIHWHGIEPTPMNDGVGHTSFEVKSEYTYQWQASTAGTYFYHCHKNTVLHFEMGMYGILIVDPKSKTKKLYDPEEGDKLGEAAIPARYPAYDAEGIWCFDDVDPRWHLYDHDAGICGEDIGMDRFEPKYFLCSGVPSNKTLTDSRTLVKAKAGSPVLLRIVNASYSELRITFPKDVLVAEEDGRVFRTNPLRGNFSKPFWTRTLNLSTAQRYSVFLDAPAAGKSCDVKTEFLHWCDYNRVQGTVTTRVLGT